MKISITHIDTACCLINIGGCQILTDPVFDEPNKITHKFYHHGFGAFSRKTSTPALSPEQLPAIDLILLSHHQHKDNLDFAGKEVLAKANKIISTKAAQKKYKNIVGLATWQSHEHLLADKSMLKITATPAQHHPSWLPEFFSGKVTGFILEHEKFQHPFYISGDTVFFQGLVEVAKRFQPAKALIHVGSAEFRYLSGFGKYTMDGLGYIKTLEQMNLQQAIPIHNGGWTHFRENNESLKATLKQKSSVAHDKTLFIKAGVKTEVDV